MATTHKIVYKNYCVPQEQIQDGGKFYLDSDCGRKLSGTGEVSVTLASAAWSNKNVAIANSAVALVSGVSFISIKNEGSDDVALSLDGGSIWTLTLPGGGSFTSQVSASASFYAVCIAPNTSVISYFTGST